MAVNYPYYPQPQPQQPMNPYIMNTPRVQYTEQPQIGIKGRPVSSIEEVRATSIDFDGSIFFFPDLANKKIYTKQINIDGTSTLNVYELKVMPLVESTPTLAIDSTQFVTREEFEAALNQLKEKIAPPPVEVAMTQADEQYKPNPMKF